MFRESSTLPQGTRRQMDRRSSMNCTYQVFNLMLSKCTPGKYEIPKDFPDSYKLARKSREEVSGIQTNPIKKFQIHNYDMTSEYFFKSVWQD